jgi:hypothetical protein
MLRKFRDAWAGLLQSEAADLPDGDFAQALGVLVAGSDLSAAEICQKARISAAGLRSWMRGYHLPQRRSLDAVHRLEGVFALPYGALAYRLPRVMFGDAVNLRRRQTGYRVYLSQILEKRYALQKYPPGLAGEWEMLVKFYTESGWLRVRGLQRNSKWRVRQHDNACPTAELKGRMVGKLMGYLCLPPDEAEPRSGGKGFARDALSLALLSDSDIVYDYLQYKKGRTYLGQYNAETRSLLEFCSALLRPDSGFLWQLPEFGAKMPTPVRAGEWHDWCVRNRSVIMSMLKDLVREGDIHVTRDPFEPILPIIVNNQHPLDVLFRLADDYEAARPIHGVLPQTKAYHYQYLLLIKLATLIPLRAFNFSVMTYRPDNTGNLYQRPDGSWWIRFDATYFKNHTGAAKEAKFDVPVHESVWPYIVEFLSTHRSHLHGADRCDYLLRPGRGSGQRVLEKPVCVRLLSHHMYRITRQYIPNCPGFSMHAFRHLVATEYVKNNPAGYAVAAAVLHDKEETVKSNYAWVVPADKFICWNEYVDGLMNAADEKLAA